MKRLLDDPNLTTYERKLLSRAEPYTLPSATEERILATIAGSVVVVGAATAGATASAATASAVTAGAATASVPAAAPAAVTIPLKAGVFGWKAVGLASLGWKVGAAVIVVSAVVGARHELVARDRAADERTLVKASQEKHELLADVAVVPPAVKDLASPSETASQPMPPSSAIAAREESSGRSPSRAANLVLPTARPASEAPSKWVAPHAVVEEGVSSTRLLEEAQFLSLAREALARHDYASAAADLRAASAYGAMKEEQTLLTIDLMRAQGRGDDANALRRSFDATHPKSVHAK